MRLPGRLAAAIEVLTEVEQRHRPVSEALKAWGLGNRFAGAGDRAAIGNLVYDALRRRASHGYVMQSETPRALILAVAVRDWGESAGSLDAVFAGDAHAPAPLTAEERARLTLADPLAGAYEPIRADIPEWIAGRFEASFGDDWVRQGQGLSNRPPLDLRVNSLKSSRERVLKALQRFHPTQTAIAPLGVRFAPGHRDDRTPNVQSDEGYLKGWFEVQDQGSQIVANLGGAAAGEQVLDLCAGSGGKSLAMAAEMANKGQIFAYDSERPRLAPIYDRIKRNGVRNVQVRAPESGALSDLVGRMDRVVVDAPCTGSGTWRRRPDTKWKLTTEQIALRCAEQRAILAEAHRYLRSGGELVYITCSVLPDENDHQVTHMLETFPDLKCLDIAERWRRHFPGTTLPGWTTHGAQLSPAATDTDGFFISVLRRT